MALYHTLRALHFGVHERPLILAHDPNACQDSALNLLHLLSGQELTVVNYRYLLELILRIVYIRATAMGSSRLGEARGSCRMSDLTRLAGMLGGGCVRSDACALVRGFGGQDLIPAVSSTEL